MSSQNECSGCGGGGAGAGTTVGGNAVASQAGGMAPGDSFIFVAFDFRVASDFPTMATSNWSVAFFTSLLLIV